jgi:alkylation response protein AidB-like acyl-CoA dehydrogenase
MADLELHAELRDVARQLLTETPPPLDWGLLADVGWLGLEVPERCAGAGAGFGEVCVVLQELGRALAPTGYLGFTVLAVAALELLAPFPQRDSLLAAVATGESRLAVVLATGDTSEPPFQIVAADEGMSVFGRADFVPEAAESQRLLLLARDPTGEPVLVSVDRDAAGLAVTLQPVLDETRSVAAVVAEGLSVTSPDIWRFRTAPESSASLLRCRAALAIACDSFGVAQAMLEATVAYAKVRHQFGRPIGSFQGVKFSCADMLVALRISQELLANAIDAMTYADPDPGVEQLEVAVARAKSFVCAHAVDIVGKALQLHGGIGYTWESGIHVALKRATLNRSWFGSPAAHRRRLALDY